MGRIANNDILPDSDIWPQNYDLWEDTSNFLLYKSIDRNYQKSITSKKVALNWLKVFNPNEIQRNC